LEYLMDIRHALILAAALILAVVGGLALHAYISTARDVARFDQVVKDEKPVHLQAAEQRQQAQQSEVANQSALTAALAAIAKQKTATLGEQDLQRIDAMITARMGAQAQPKAEVPKDAGGQDLPSAASTAVNSKSLRDYMLDCDATGVELGSCRKTVGNLNAQLEAERSDHRATQKELQAAQAAIKGGSFWTRMRRGARHSLCGSAAGATGAALGMKNRNPTLAAGVALAVFGACELL
jgi:hypothetical protein